MGLFTAYHASERRARVVVLERGRIGDPATASYGRTRSFRNDYLDATYARLAHEAFRLWGDFERRTGAEVLVRCGCMNIAKRSVTPDLARTYAQLSFETLTRLGLDTESFDARGAAPALPLPRRGPGPSRRRRRRRRRARGEPGARARPRRARRAHARGRRDERDRARRRLDPRDHRRGRVRSRGRSWSPPGTAPTTSCRCCRAAGCRSRSRRTGPARPSTSSRPRTPATGSRRTRCR